MFIEIKKLSRFFSNHKVLNDLNYSFPSTGLFILEGENGSGKSTLLDILDFLDKDYEGSILYDGKEIKEYKDNETNEIHRNQIVYVTQKESFLPFFNKKENETLKPYWKRDKNKNQTSSGERMLSVLKRALLPGKRLYLLDEVTANLDENNTKRLIADIIELSKGSLVILVTHDLRVSDISCTVLSLDKGKLKIKKKENYNSIKNKKIDKVKNKPSLTLLIKGILKTQIMRSTMVFFLFFFAFLMSEGPISYTIYDFKLGLNQFVKSGDLVHLTGDERTIYKQELNENNFPSDGLLIYDNRIPNDNRIHMTGRQSLLYERRLKEQKIFNTNYFFFSLPDVVIDDSLPFDGYFVNPGFKDSWMNSSHLINGLTVPSVPYSADGSDFNEDIIFTTVNSLRLSNVDSYRQLYSRLPSTFSVNDNEIFFSRAEMRSKKIIFDSYPDGLKESVYYLYPDLGNIIGDRFISIDENINQVNTDMNIVIVSDGAMDRIIRSTKDDWISSLYISVDGHNLNHYRDYIYDFIKRGGTHEMKLIKRNDQLIVTAIDEFEQKGKTNPYDFYVKGSGNRNSFLTPALLLQIIIMPHAILVLCLAMTYFYFFNNSKNKIKTCYSLGWSKTSIFLAYSSPSILASILAYVICFYLSLMSWGLTDVGAWGFNYMPQFQWPMLLIMLVYVIGVASLQLIFYLKVLKKK